MSDETTATWMFGRPFGKPASIVMNDGSCVSIFICSGVIDDELSTMNRMSRSPRSPAASAPWLRWTAGAPSSGAHATVPTAATATESNENPFDRRAM